MMTYYHSQIARIRQNSYANKGQLISVIETRHYINDNYGKELSLDLLSNVLCTSKYHLLRLFKKYYGQTPKQYLIDRRIAEAKQILKKGTSVAEACFEVGFDSPCSFSTLFKSRVGLNPSEFQKRAISTKSD